MWMQYEVDFYQPNGKINPYSIRVRSCNRSKTKPYEIHLANWQF